MLKDKFPDIVGLLLKLYDCPVELIVSPPKVVNVGKVNGPVPVQFNTRLEEAVVRILLMFEEG